MTAPFRQVYEGRLYANLQVSGMKIRFLTLIRELRKAGDDVLVVTPDRNPPQSYHGAKVRGNSALRRWC